MLQNFEISDKESYLKLNYKMKLTTSAKSLISIMIYLQ